MEPTTTREQMAAIIADHFPEYISATCLCGQTISNVAVWADHLAEVLWEAIP